MTTSDPRCRTPTLLLAALLLIASAAPLLAASTPATAQGQPITPPGPPDEPGPGESPNGAPQNGAQANGTNGGATGRPDGTGPPEGGLPDPDRRPVDPVAIRDTAQGFRTQAPTGSVRPAVDVDAARATASVARSDTDPLEFQLDALIEYVDENKNGAYDLGEPVIHRVPLRGAPYEILIDTENGTRDIEFALGAGGSLTLRFHLDDVPGPTVGVKFDVLIDAYAFRNETSRLALGMRVDSPGGLQAGSVDGEDALLGDRGTSVPYLSWENGVAVDGALHTVASSIHLGAGTANGTQSAILYWSYPRGASIVHDPILGVTEATLRVAGDMAPFILGAGIAMAVVGVGYAARRRTRF